MSLIRVLVSVAAFASRSSSFFKSRGQCHSIWLRPRSAESPAASPRRAFLGPFAPLSIVSTAFAASTRPFQTRASQGRAIGLKPRGAFAVGEQIIMANTKCSSARYTTFRRPLARTT